MRAARYRAWDTKEKSWIDLHTTGLTFARHPDSPDAWVVIITKDGNSEIKNDIILQQYTGLYSDDEEEICEGDVTYAYKNNSSLEGHYIVVWDSKRGRWAYKSGNHIEKYQVGKVGNMHCTIQGNYLEHIELQYIANL